MFSKHDTFTTNIYYYIMVTFGNAKHDLHIATLPSYGGVVLQWFEFIKVCMGRNSYRHIAKILIFLQ